ncbi:suppressor of fused domain protein [Clostridiaceae bacterium WCA-383-APC-5B]|uniref:Suppressor of fused domain protein n=1 Tax=Inconstantimicrobium porci TaxID=2652291 RepID=A0A7X2N0F9_9CLOT|nr:suppressor of fused domain protein [Inconstantimicrobium porci]
MLSYILLHISCFHKRINNLWLVPLTSAEYEFAQSNSSEELLDKYSGNFNDLVVFDGHAKFL